MAKTYGKKKHKQNYLLYTVVSAILLCMVFLAMVNSLYISAKEGAYETLHIQTKQIKDDINLQILSDRENLSTMANFAANLYEEHKRYDIMFQSFKPIGLIENIGILNADNTFVTKAGIMDVNDILSFEEESKKGAYISSRISDVTTHGNEIVRSAVPIVSDGETVGILYGAIQLNKIAERYHQMAVDLNAQLFVYDKTTGDLIIDNVHEELGNISFLKDREYNEDYSYEKFSLSDKGFTSFLSAYRNENVYLHYSTIDELGWMIAMARYDSQVFSEVGRLSNFLLVIFIVIIAIIVVYIAILMASEKRVNQTAICASEIRKILLLTGGGTNNVSEALKLLCEFGRAKFAIYFDTDGEDYSYVEQGYKDNFSSEEKIYFKSELLRYASEYHKSSGTAVNILCIKPDAHLKKTNCQFYEFLIDKKIHEISLSATINNTNHITILATINSKRGKRVRSLDEKISACFTIALNNKNHLDVTTYAATTDPLTGVLNRASFRGDVLTFDVEKPSQFSCIYIDVNGLHLLNNKFGHAAGDEMLVFIANTLKEVFFGQKVYRLGGDEFLVFCKNTDRRTVKKGIETFVEKLRVKEYYVAIGFSYRAKNTGTEELVHEAEVRMFEAKAWYYQNNRQNSKLLTNNEYVQAKTGIPEIDTTISILKESYGGIYCVSLNSDNARCVLMPAYLKYKEYEDNFSELFSKYIYELVDPDYHRAIMSFLNYSAIKNQLMEGKIPKIKYKKTDGEKIVLSVYKLRNELNTIDNTLWVFAKVKNS